jgi:hypothetical protein
MRLLKIHLRAALVAAGGDVDRAARMLGLTSADAARLFANDSCPPPRPGQSSGTWSKVRTEDDSGSGTGDPDSA